jgi:hypothetical protein
VVGLKVGRPEVEWGNEVGEEEVAAGLGEQVLAQKFSKVRHVVNLFNEGLRALTFSEFRNSQNSQKYSI